MGCSVRVWDGKTSDERTNRHCYWKSHSAVYRIDVTTTVVTLVVTRHPRKEVTVVPLLVAVLTLQAASSPPLSLSLIPSLSSSLPLHLSLLASRLFLLESQSSLGASQWLVRIHSQFVSFHACMHAYIYATLSLPSSYLHRVHLSNPPSDPKSSTYPHRNTSWYVPIISSQPISI